MVFRTKKKTSKLPIIIFIVIFGFFCAYKLILYIDKKATPIFINYAEIETKKILTMIINKSLTDEMLKDHDLNGLFEVKTNEGGDIQLLDFNSIKVNRFLTEYTDKVYLNIKNIEKGKIDTIEFSPNELTEEEIEELRRGIIYNMPIGIATDSYLLSNLGPRIPVRFSMIGAVTTNMVTNVKEYGINNALIEIGIDVTVTGKITLALGSKEILVQAIIPLSTKVIQGNIPNYYLNGFTSQSNISSKNS